MSEKSRMWKTFLVGFLIGGACVYGGLRIAKCYRGHGWGPRGRFNSQRLLEKFSRKLDLTPDQKVQVDRILQQNLAKMKELKASVHPQFEAIRGAIQTEVRAVLTPDQQVKFNRMVEDFENRRKRWKQREGDG